MKAAVYYGKNDIKIQDVPVPQINEDEYLLKVNYCGLCKTDIKKIRGITLKTKGTLEGPRVFGHEIVGEVETVGSNIKNLKKGDRVAIFHHVPCLECYYCSKQEYTQCETYRKIDTESGIGKPSGGGFGEYVKVPKLIAERGTIKIPDHITDQEAAFIEPTNCCLKGIQKADIQFGESVAVFGQGPIGLTLDQLVKLRGGSVIGVDLVDYRLNDAVKFYDIDHTINASKTDLISEVKKVTEGRGVDVSIVAVESPKAVDQAIKCTRGGGRVIFFSEFGDERTSNKNQLAELVDSIYSKEISIHGCYSSSYLDHDLAANLKKKKKIKKKEMISHDMPLEKLMEAVDIADKRRDLDWEGTPHADEIKESLKILIKVSDG